MGVFLLHARGEAARAGGVRVSVRKLVWLDDSVGAKMFVVDGDRGGERRASGIRSMRSSEVEPLIRGNKRRPSPGDPMGRGLPIDAAMGFAFL